jgi:hypothetical protein
MVFLMAGFPFWETSMLIFGMFLQPGKPDPQPEGDGGHYS